MQNRNCQLGEWSSWSECPKCGPNDIVRVRIPRTEQDEDDNLQKIIELHGKLVKRNRRSNNDDDEEEEEQEEEEDGEDGEEDEDVIYPSDLEVEEISDTSHSCFGKDLIQKKKCAKNYKKCRNDGKYRTSAILCNLKLFDIKCPSSNRTLFTEADKADLR